MTKMDVPKHRDAFRRRGLSLAEWFVFSIPGQWPTPQDEVPSLASSQSEGDPRGKVSEEECVKAIGSLKQRGWLQVITEQSAAKLIEQHRSQGLPDPLYGFPSPGDLDFTPIGANQFLSLSAELYAPDFFAQALVASDDDSELDFFAVRRDLTKEFVKNLKSSEEPPQHIELRPISVWCIYWWKCFAAGFHVKVQRNGSVSKLAYSPQASAIAEPTKQGLFSSPNAAIAQGAIKCLGLVFSNDDERRKYFTTQLREKLEDPTFRKVEGFPVGNNEDIMALSNPPYYTACPNPFLADIVDSSQSVQRRNEAYHRTPFAVDVSEGKTDSLYKAHSYHTKVPHLAIVPSLLHYTEPGDIILDGFCGSGMTGVAAQFCDSPPAAYRSELEERWSSAGRGKPSWGPRRVILNDLSPAATFIAANYNTPFDVDAFAEQSAALLEETRKDVGWMYQTLHSDGHTHGEIEYTVWSEVSSCPNCTGEVVFSDEALDATTNKIRDTFPCPHCHVILTKSRLEPVFESRFDKLLKRTVEAPKRKPVLIVYKIGKTRFKKTPTADDLNTLQMIEKLEPPTFPSKEFPFRDMWEATRLLGRKITHVHHLFLLRQIHALSSLWTRASQCKDARTREFLVFFAEQAIWGMSILARYAPTHFSQVNQYLAGVYYVGSQHAECSPWYILTGKRERLVAAFKRQFASLGNAFISTGDSARLPMPAQSVDYIFTDPPFGDNLPYAELNFVVEAFLNVMTDPAPEAVVDRAKKNQTTQKRLSDYQRLMERCFAEYFRVLKPGRWLTVVFSNSKNSVWTAIQEAMARAGFIVADVRTLDKQQQSFKQVTSIAVKQDLVISAYKPTDELEAKVKLEAGTESGAWDFVRTHLGQLPVFVAKGDRAEVVAERLNYFLFDRMVAFHVQRGYSVPMSASEFHAGLRRRFPERDSMYFLPEQVSEYDSKRLEVKATDQLELFVNDEKGAIQWVRLQLSERPMTFQELQPLYMKEAQRVWEKHEQPIELVSILTQGFVKDDDDRWHVPDHKNESHLEQVRTRELLKEFQNYLETKGKLKVVRTEALRAGFKESWQNKQYTTIVQMGKRVPEAVIHEDQALLMYFDNASLLLGE